MNSAYFNRLARYNAWANRRLYDACAQLSVSDYRAKRPSFFGSIHATLNHILVGDRVWLSRFEGRSSDIKGLDQILHDDLAALRAAREAEDAHILACVGTLGDDDLMSRTLRYRNMAGEPQETPLVWTLAHVFNHQTHHRGQAHCMLSGTPVAPPSLDLIYFLREDRA
ncbi:MAG: DinB family protein [Dongiaceae bacterium]